MVILFGSINLDLSFNLPKIPAAGETVLGPTVHIEPGGKGANQAVAAARDGGAVVMAGAIGNDPLGAGALALLQQAGVNLKRVKRVGVSTRTYASYVAALKEEYGVETRFQLGYAMGSRAASDGADPAPPDAITGIETASATAPVISRS